MQNLRLNAIAYIKLLYTVVKLWIERVIIHVPSVLCTLPHSPCDPRVTGQEFSQLYHLIIRCLLALLIWIPSTTISGMLSRKKSNWSHNTNNSLKLTIIDLMTNMNKNHLIWVSSHFWGHPWGSLVLLNNFFFLFNLNIYTNLKIDISFSIEYLCFSSYDNLFSIIWYTLYIVKFKILSTFDIVLGINTA